MGWWWLNILIAGFFVVELRDVKEMVQKLVDAVKIKLCVFRHTYCLMSDLPVSRKTVQAWKGQRSLSEWSGKLPRIIAPYRYQISLLQSSALACCLGRKNWCFQTLFSPPHSIGETAGLPPDTGRWKTPAFPIFGGEGKPACHHFLVHSFCLYKFIGDDAWKCTNLTALGNWIIGTSVFLYILLSVVEGASYFSVLWHCYDLGKGGSAHGCGARALVCLPVCSLWRNSSGFPRP